jgi:putative flippase GtrA
MLFLIVGSLTVLIDYATYRSLVKFECISIDIAKGVGFVAGTLFAFFANRLWTFGQKQHAAGSVWRFIVLYVVSSIGNVLVNRWVLSVLIDWSGAATAAFFVATGISSIMNFFGMKFFVFKEIDPLRLE